MINLQDFISYLSNQGFTLSSGVPCSYFKDLLINLERNSDIHYVTATREDEAVGLASGYFLGDGKKCFLIMQNSGLANIGDALTSLAQLYQIPLLILVSYRGLEPDNDFPEHSIMGKVTESVLDAYKVPYWNLKEINWVKTLDLAVNKMNKTSLPVCLLIEKGVLSE
ncbi:MAG: thiamine pyrophosphate-binding protein [Candidatus Thorarchaeota archaeon]